MSFFRTMPDAMQAQREELENIYRDLCQDVSEIGGVIRQLKTMSGFQDTIAALCRIQRNGGEQQVKLRQSAHALGRVAELYRRAELENLDGGRPGVLYGWAPVRTAEGKVPDGENDGEPGEILRGWKISPIRKIFPGKVTMTCEPQEMLADAAHWYGTDVVIPQKKSEKEEEQWQ